MSADTKRILNEYWGFERFRPLQEEIIDSVLHRNDTLALLPTGGGKSICYQVPAFAMDGICLVISPLIALMKDQVENLRKKNITSFSLTSGMSRKEVISILKIAANSNCKFLYVSPERLETSIFNEFLPSLGIKLIAVDEAHCISQWGYDFRPSYLKIAKIREELPGVPVIALTASATREVQDDICEKLLFKNKQVFRQSFERPNLSYSCFQTNSKYNRIIEILKNVPGSALVYCKSRRRTKEISDLLKLEGIPSEHYHAGLNAIERNFKQTAWIENNIRVITCTNAFGMGIDKPDVRLVIHADPPESLENYYQEAGRAGRDGQKSYAVLLYDANDIPLLEKSVNIRFPSIQRIREIYQSLANYLHLGTGMGEGEYFDFELTDFARKFHYPPIEVIHVLQTLEQEGYVSYNEQVFSPSLIQFTASRNVLFDIETKNPAFDSVIKTMLRTYEGIFDMPVHISESFIAAQLKIEMDELKSRLVSLQKLRIIDYIPRKEKPQLYLNMERVRAESILVNNSNYKFRKERFVYRLSHMIDFIRNNKGCRSRIISEYFGDEKARDCDICDNCLRKKKSEMKRIEFDRIGELIGQALSGTRLTSEQLISRLHGIKKEKALEVIKFLQSENRIELDKYGSISLKSVDT